MADNSDPDQTRRGPSASLFITGVLALAVSVWAFLGPASMPAASMIPVGWIVVIAAILIGVLLAVSPRRRR